MKVFILTPEKTIYQGEAISIQIIGKDGSFQLLANHASMIYLLKQAYIHLQQSIDHYFIFCIANGVLEVKKNMVKILVN